MRDLWQTTNMNYGARWGLATNPKKLQSIAANSLVIAGKIPGAWLVPIKDAGHALPAQYPDKLNRVLQTFLSTTSNPG
jgi:pimeloyl-ACP methyl ester carboxylesterase